MVELCCESSYRRDLRSKVEVYRALGISEYFVFDVDRRHLPALLEGWRLTPAGDYQAIPPELAHFGLRRLHSRELALDLEVVHDRSAPGAFFLRAFLPGSADPLPTHAEADLQAELRAREAELRAQAERIRELEEELRRRGPLGP